MRFTLTKDRRHADSQPIFPDRLDAASSRGAMKNEDDVGTVSTSPWVRLRQGRPNTYVVKLDESLVDDDHHLAELLVEVKTLLGSRVRRVEWVTVDCAGLAGARYNTQLAAVLWQLVKVVREKGAGVRFSRVPARLVDFLVWCWSCIAPRGFDG